MKKVKALQPRYYKDFQCIGGDCKYSCCRSWSVIIDKASYDKYMAVKDAAMRKTFSDNITVNSNEPFSASSVLDEKGACAFLNEGGLCWIQLNYDHSFLSNTCRNFPRKIHYIGNDLELCMGLSCEAAAVIALFDSKPMTFEETTFVIDKQFVFSGRLNTGLRSSADNAYDIFRKLRSASLFIIQCRKYKLWERLIILGLFIKQADALLSAGNNVEVSAFADEFTAQVENIGKDEFIGAIPSDDITKISFIMNILSINEIHSHSMIRDCVIRMAIGLGITGEGQELPEMHVVVDCYNYALNKYFSPYFVDKEYVFENFLVNMIFMSGFPFSYSSETSSNIFRNYTKLVIKFCLIKFLLVGMSGFYKKDFGRDAVIKGIVAFSRSFEHDRDVTEKVLEIIDKRNMSGLKALSVLIKE